MALGAQQDVQAPIAEPALLSRQLFQAASEILVWRPMGAIANVFRSVLIRRHARRSLIS